MTSAHSAASTGALALCLFASGCTTVVHRWALQGPERAGAALETTAHPDIFEDFLWSTPPIASRKLELVPAGDERVARLDFAGETLEMTLQQDNTLTAVLGAMKTSATLTRSKRDRYADLSALGKKVVMRQRLVSRTRMVTRSEPVTKTRYTTKSVPVTRTRSVSYYDSFAKSTRYRTETYTDYEMRSQSETYTAYETRTHWEPYLAWMTVPEEIVDIPELEYFELRFSDRTHLLLYRIPRSAGPPEYLLQNPGYIAAHDTQRALSSGRVSVIAIDANSNGIYFEPEDRIFFNTMNPYRRDSAYAELPRFLDNYWYRVSELEEHHLLWVALEGGRLRFSSPNAKFAGVTERGSLAIAGLPAGARISLNGRTFGPLRSEVFEAAIEFGVYQLHITAPGASEQVERLTVDEAHRAVRLAFRPAPSGSLSIANISLDHWKVIVRAGDRLVGVHSDARSVQLAPGSYDVTVESGGYRLGRAVSIHRSEETTLDYDALVSATVGS